MLAVGELRFVAVSQDGPLTPAAPLIDELAVEYADRVLWYLVPAFMRGCADTPARNSKPPWWRPADRVARRATRSTGGAFRRFDDATAELKRIWTDSRHRRRGRARATGDPA